ncbi:MAG: FeoB-associated Cys-rich membrane protein [Ruminococcus bromii]
MIAFVVARMVKDKKEGKSSCGANCAHCACHGDCHNHK